MRDELTELVAIKEQGQVVTPGRASHRSGGKGQTAAVRGKGVGADAAMRRARREHALSGDPPGMGRRRAARADKSSRETCAEPHISIIGHITKHGAAKAACRSDAANGFANRILWVCSTRSKCLALGGAVDAEALAAFGARAGTCGFCRGVEDLAWAPDAAQRWEAVYPQLSEGKPGLFGQVTARAEAQTLRLAMVYALLDKSAQIRLEHLEAALELWRYCSDSAAFIFGASLGNPLADAILEVLRAHPEGMTRTDVNNHFGRNKTKAALDAAIAVAQRNGSLRIEKRETGGRAAELLQS